MQERVRVEKEEAFDEYEEDEEKEHYEEDEERESDEGSDTSDQSDENISEQEAPWLARSTTANLRTYFMDVHGVKPTRGKRGLDAVMSRAKRADVLDVKAFEELQKVMPRETEKILGQDEKLTLRSFLQAHLHPDLIDSTLQKFRKLEIKNFDKLCEFEHVVQQPTFTPATSHIIKKALAAHKKDRALWEVFNIRMQAFQTFLTSQGPGHAETVKNRCELIKLMTNLEQQQPRVDLSYVLKWHKASAVGFVLVSCPEHLLPMAEKTVMRGNGWTSVVGTATNATNTIFLQHKWQAAMSAKWEDNVKNIFKLNAEMPLPQLAQKYGLEKQPTVVAGCVKGGEKCDWEMWHFKDPDTLTTRAGDIDSPGLLSITDKEGKARRMGYAPGGNKLEIHTRAFIQDHLNVNVKMALFSTVAELDTFFEKGMPLTWLQ